MYCIMCITYKSRYLGKIYDNYNDALEGAIELRECAEKCSWKGLVRYKVVKIEITELEEGIVLK